MCSIFWTREKLITMLSAWRFVAKISILYFSDAHLRKGLLSSIKLRAKNMRLGKHLPCFWCVPTWLVYILWSYVICIYGCNSRWLGVRFMDVVPGLDNLNMTSAGPSQWLSWCFLEQCSHCDSQETSFVWHSLPQKQQLCFGLKEQEEWKQQVDRCRWTNQRTDFSTAYDWRWLLEKSKNRTVDLCFNV